MKRNATICLILVATLVGVVPYGRAGARTGGPMDDRILSSAALQRGHASSASTVRWLRRQSAVGRVALGADRQTIDVHFRDGRHALILSDTIRPVTVPRFRQWLQPRAVPRSPGGPQAAVWEPFATELGLGAHAGDEEVQRLSAAGFSVDQRYDTDVTVARLTTMANFNVLYMHTHSGVSATGDGVVASGEPVNGDPSVLPYLQDGSVITVGVAGTSQQYYGITGAFIASHVGAFKSHSLLFLNGCALLRAPAFWATLQARGAAVLVSWDQNAAAKDDFLSAAAFFNVMGSGQSVSGAISTLRSAGYGVSSDNGIPAVLGFEGDGTLTLASAAAGGSVTPTVPPATPTAMPSSVPTSVPVPSASATPTPVSAPAATSTSTPVPTHPPVPALVSLVGLVAPGAQQIISVTNLVPATPVDVSVTYPNGQVLALHGTADPSGGVRITFNQAGSTLTRWSRTANVAITATTASGSATTVVHFTVAYGKIDLVANPRALRVGATGAILVHTGAGKAVTLTVKPVGARARSMHLRTGPRGWGKLTYRIRSAARRGHPVHIRATVRLNDRTFNAVTTVTVL